MYIGRFYTILHGFSVSDYISRQSVSRMCKITRCPRGRFSWLAGWLAGGWLVDPLQFFILVRDSVKKCLAKGMQVVTSWAGCALLLLFLLSGRGERAVGRACSCYPIGTGSQIGHPPAVPSLTPRVKNCLIHHL